MEAFADLPDALVRDLLAKEDIEVEPEGRAEQGRTAGGTR